MIGKATKVGNGFVLVLVPGMPKTVFVHSHALPPEQRSRIDGVKDGDEIEIMETEQHPKGPRAVSARLLTEPPAPKNDVRGLITEMYDGHGFIRSEDARRVFFAPALCASDSPFDDLYENDPVIFDDGESHGRPVAKNVRLMRAASDEAA